MSTFLGIGNPFANPTPQSDKAKKATAKQGVTQAELANSFIQSRPRPTDFPDGFQIYEIRNGKIPDKPTIALIENRMPKVPFTYGGEQRIVKDYYPGNSEPVMHILGPKESDVVISGRLYDKKFKGDPSLYGASYALASVLDGIRLRGNLCKFKMGVWVRYGFLQKTEFPLKRLGDIEYHMTLDIAGFNLPRNAFFADTAQAPFAINEAALALTQAHTAAYVFGANLSKEQANIVANAPKSTIDDLNSAISDVATQINKVTGFVDSVFKAGENILAVANRALGLIKNAQRAITQYKRRLSQINSTFRNLSLTNKTPAAGAASQAIVSNHIIGQISAANGLHSTMAALNRNIQAIALTVPLGRIRVQATDTLQKIAAKHYGNADLWTKIFDHNNLTSTQLTPGQVLELPKV